ncbi:MAG: tetratricopeptide repeat protein [Planctomycetes bacterium]|nr:tetratricopeptide repeat protein [Planctomycetota bacterium]
MGELEQGKSEYETGRWSKAYSLFQKALEGRNDSAREVAEVRLLMARCLAQMGEPEKAQTELKDVRDKLSPKDKDLVNQFELVWREVEDTRKLDKAELARRKAEAQAEKN